MVDLHHNLATEKSALINEKMLVDRLRAGDETAFLTLVETLHSPMIRIALSYVANIETAEEVVQETWMGVLRGIDRFEGRSCLKTWIFCILTNRAKSRGKRESRCLSFADCGNAHFAGNDDDASESAVSPDRFLPADHQWPDHWSSPPNQWSCLPEDRVLKQEICARIEQQIERLPPSQRRVMILRDIEGWTAEEVCSMLKISPANQRVLLHSARSKVRGALEHYFDTKAEAHCELEFL